jgi:ATP-dependent Clp protease, protease subunit
LNQKVAIEFIADVSYKNISKLFSLIEREIDKGINDFILFISSHGGDTYVGLRSYNQLKLLSKKVKLTTYNLGFVESAAMNLYCAGEHRFAIPNSWFLFHQSIVNYEKKSFSEMQLEEELNKLKSSNHTSINIIVDNSNLIYEDAKKLYYTGTILKPEQAKKIGLVHNITDDIKSIIGTNYKIYTIENE